MALYNQSLAIPTFCSRVNGDVMCGVREEARHDKEEENKVMIDQTGSHGRLALNNKVHFPTPAQIVLPVFVSNVADGI